MFSFSADSVIVKSWVNLIRDRKRTQQQVPDLYNLRDLVFAELETP
ncbi:MAG: hypothetical protein MSA90_21960 [Faecalicatena sp.]|nr:hypothetical protein [Faecalicatena sp.]MCI6468116.1 hypothetical protein [Faecalicatena sp.]MDY4670915.1 hypothetical protein [Oliverpabstia sp.]MDY5620369.1 hypothetical protein [Lachnospiraceae bacterium]